MYSRARRLQRVPSSTLMRDISQACHVTSRRPMYVDATAANISAIDSPDFLFAILRHWGKKQVSEARFTMSYLLRDGTARELRGEDNPDAYHFTIRKMRQDIQESPN